jgi:ABC-type transport system involved in multi-copper enzyme maturation permease subunit
MASVESVRRVALIATTTARDVGRHRLLQLWLALAIGLVFAGRLFRELNFGEAELTFLSDVGFGVAAFFGGLLTIAVTAHTFFGELEQRSVQAVLARPVSRTEFLLGKLLGVMAIMAGFCVLVTAVVLALVSARAVELRHAGVENVLVPWCGLVVQGACEAARLAVVAAMTLLVCTLARSALVAMGVSTGWLVASHLQPVAAAVYARDGGAVGTALSRALGLLTPRLDILERGTGNAGWLLAYIALYFVGCVALAAWCFRRRDL